MDMIPEGDLTFELAEDLESYGFVMEDCVEDIFRKYFRVHDHLTSEIREHVLSVVDKNRPTGTLGEAF